MNINLTVDPNNPNRHECNAFRVGNEIVFKCPQCPTYERRINTITGKMTVPKEYNEEAAQLIELGLRPDIRHFGSNGMTDKPLAPHLN